MESHSHCRCHSRGKSGIALAFALNFGFAVLEAAGGILTNSIAILSDAVHDLGDSLSLAMSFFIERKANARAKERFTYGYKRLPVIGALLNIIILSAGTVYVIGEALAAFGSPREVRSEGMFILAVAGIVINGVAVLRMKGSKKILEKTVMLHLLEDLMGWIAVLAASAVIYFTGFYILDSILSLIISAVIIKNIISNVKESVNIIMQAAPEKKQKAIRQKIERVGGIGKIEELHIWTLDGEELVVTAKIRAGEAGKDFVYNEVKNILAEENITESTVEVI